MLERFNCKRTPQKEVEGKRLDLDSTLLNVNLSNLNTQPQPRLLGAARWGSSRISESTTIYSSISSPRPTKVRWCLSLSFLVSGSVFMCLSLSLSLFVFLYFHFCLSYLCLCLCLCLCLSVSVSVSVSLSVSVSVSVLSHLCL